VISTRPPDYKQQAYTEANIPRGCCLACQNPAFGTAESRPSSEKHQPRVSTAGVNSPSARMGRGRAQHTLTRSRGLRRVQLHPAPSSFMAAVDPKKLDSLWNLAVLLIFRCLM